MEKLSLYTFSPLLEQTVFKFILQLMRSASTSQTGLIMAIKVPYPPHKQRELEGFFFAGVSKKKLLKM